MGQGASEEEEGDVEKCGMFGEVVEWFTAVCEGSNGVLV